MGERSEHDPKLSPRTSFGDRRTVAYLRPLAWRITAAGLKPPPDFPRIDRLLHECGTPILLNLTLARHRVAAHDDHGERGTQLPQALDQLKAIHTGHSNVRDNGVSRV